MRLRNALKYRCAVDRVRWEGRAVEDAVGFQDYMRHVVGPQLNADDLEMDAVLRGLATTEMATGAIERLLDSLPPSQGWEVGEALAECILDHDMGWTVHWLWRTSRDRRTPKARLQGTDLVGFVQRDDEFFLLFGEVKTSGEARRPPTVMTGPSGLPRQLAEIALRPDIQCALLSWLRVRCRSQFQRDLFKKATSRYINSEGQDFVLVGVLLRDTVPDERDLRRPAEVLSRQLPAAPASVRLVAWYLPVEIDRWPALVGAPT